MGTTPNLGIEFPDPSAVPSRETWIEKPIRSVDTKVKAVLDRINAGIRARGTATVSLATAANGGTTTVAFPEGRFTAAPRVFLTKQSGSLAKYIPYAANITATGCTIGIYSGDGSTATGSASIAWEAVQD